MTKKKPGKVSFKKARNYQRPFLDTASTGIPYIDRELAQAVNCDACPNIGILTFMREGKRLHRCPKHVNWVA